MDFGDVALIRQVVLAWAIGVVHFRQATVGQLAQGNLVALEVGTDEGIEGFLAGFGEQVAVHCRQPLRRYAHAVEEGVQALLRGLALVFLPEAHQVIGTFLVREAGQVFLAARVGVVL